MSRKKSAVSPPESTDDLQPADPADVHYTAIGTDGSFHAAMRLQIAVPTAVSTTVMFDTGLSGLPLKVQVSNVGLQITTTVDLELAFTYTATGADPHTVLDTSTKLS